MKALDQRVAIVTGGARGIGAAIAKELAEAGAHIVICDICEPTQARTVLQSIEAMGRKALFFRASVADRPAVAGMIDEVVQKFGRIDILVNNAAMNIRKPLVELEPEDVAKVWDVILWGAFHCTQLVVRQLLKQGGRGSIVLISSVHAHRPYALSTAYNGAKAAVNQMAATWANELAGKGIRVNAVEPGWTDTEGERHAFSDQFLAGEAATLPMKRLGEPREIAAMVRFLVSDDASYITGGCFRVDGGMSLSR